MTRSTTTDKPEPAVDSEAGPYLDAVAARLAGARNVGEAERRELLDDLALHLAEVAAEGDSLAARLGPPAVYAGELLASAGVETGRTHGRLRDRLRLGWRAGRDRVEHVAEDPRLAPVRDALPDLTPAGWVLRGWLLAVLLGYLTSGGDTLLGTFPIPAVLGSTLVGLVGVVGFVLGSVIVGRRMRDSGPPSTRARWFNRAVTVVCAIVALAVFANQRTGPSYSGPVFTQSLCPVNRAGEPVDNLYAYDAEGRLLDPVLLYDQTGAPVELCPSGIERGPFGVDRGPVDGNGAAVPNVFPRPQVDPWSGQPVPPPAVVIPRLATSTTTTTAPTTTTATTAAPGTTGG